MSAIVFAGWALWKVWENSRDDGGGNLLPPPRGFDPNDPSAGGWSGGGGIDGGGDSIYGYRKDEGVGGIKPLGRSFTALELAGGGGGGK